MPKPKPTELAHIDPDLRPLARAIDSVQPWESNPRQGDVGAIMTILGRFGQKKAIVVQKSTMKIVAGNHTWRAASELGWKYIAMNVSDMSDKEARAYALADNRASDLAAYDENILLAELKLIGTSDEDLMGTGFETDDLQTLFERTSTAPRPGSNGGSEIVDEKWGIVVMCKSETQQVELLERLAGEGVECRALVA